MNTITNNAPTVALNNGGDAVSNGIHKIEKKIIFDLDFQKELDAIWNKLDTPTKLCLLEQDDSDNTVVTEGSDSVNDYSAEDDDSEIDWSGFNLDGIDVSLPELDNLSLYDDDDDEEEEEEMDSLTVEAHWTNESIKLSSSPVKKPLLLEVASPVILQQVHSAPQDDTIVSGETMKATIAEEQAPTKSFKEIILQQQKPQEEDLTTDWSALRVIDLRQELKNRGLKMVGRKADLIARLEEYEQERTAIKQQANSNIFINNNEMGDNGDYDSDSGDEEETYDVEPIVVGKSQRNVSVAAPIAVKKKAHTVVPFTQCPMQPCTILRVGDDEVAKVLHFLRFYYHRRTPQLLRAAREIVWKYHECNPDKSKSAAGPIFQGFMALLGPFFSVVLQGSLRLSVEEVRNTAW